MNIREKWVNGILVDAFNWVDGRNIYLNMRSWKNGSSIERKPDWEKTVLIPLEEEQKLRENLHSIVTHFAYR